MKIGILGNVGKDINRAYSWFMRTCLQGFTLLGHQVKGIDYKTNSFSDIISFFSTYKPDILLTHTILRGTMPIEPGLNLLCTIKRKTGCFIIHTMQDARTNIEYPKNISSAFDMALIGHEVGLNRMEACWKVPVKYFPYSSLVCDKISPPIDKFRINNLLFLGRKNIHKDRKEFLEKLLKISNLKIIETQQKGDLRNKTWELSGNATCILGACTGYDVFHYIDVRPWQYLGMGAFMIIRKFKGMDDLIPEDIYIPFVGYSQKDAIKVVELYNYWKDKDTSIIRNRAHTYVQQNHTCVIRMGKLLKEIKHG